MAKENNELHSRLQEEIKCTLYIALPFEKNTAKIGSIFVQHCYSSFRHRKKTLFNPVLISEQVIMFDLAGEEYPPPGLDEANFIIRPQNI